MKLHLRLQLALVFAFGFALQACVSTPLKGSGGTLTAFNVNVVSGGVNILQAPSQIDLHCEAGQQLIGGGFKLLNTNNRFPTLVAAIASYPSDQNTWSFKFVNPDDRQVYTGDDGVQLITVAYCAVNAGNLGISIVQKTSSLTSQPVSVSAACPQGSTLVSGGYQTSGHPPFSLPSRDIYDVYWPGTTQTGLVSSFPSDNAWNIVAEDTSSLYPAGPQGGGQATVYAVCSRGGFAPGTPIVSGTCPEGQFSVGGGFENYPIVLGDPQQKTPVSTLEGSSALAASGPIFNAWDIEGNSVGQSFSNVALCIPIPQT